MLDIEKYMRYKTRIDQLTKSINIMNSYDEYLRIKYYPAIEHNIALLMQYHLLIKELNN